MSLRRLFSNRKLKILLFLFFFLVPLITRTVLAYETEADTPIDFQMQFEDALDAPEMNLESFVHETMRSIVASIIHFLFNVPAFISGASSSADPSVSPVAFNQDLGAIPNMMGLITFLYVEPPVSGISYLAHVRERIGIAAPAYAQSFGFESLRPVMKVWVAFRDLTYALFAFALVIAGFMIMFRIKISPQAVITIQTALPKVVVALLFITFSYAIAGFILDLTYLILFLALQLFRSVDLLGGVLDREFLGMPVYWDFIKAALTGLNAFGFGLLVLFFSSSSLFIMINNLISGFLSAPPPFDALVQLLFGSTLSIVLLLILLIVLFFVLLKIFVMLLKNYINIILSVIIAPFQILLGIFPGVSGFGTWFKNMIAYASVFPITGILFLIAAILMGRPGGVDLDPFGRQPSGFSSGASPPPLVGSMLSQPGTIEGLIGLGIIFLIPSICERLQNAIRRPLGLESAIGWGAVAPYAMAPANLFLEAKARQYTDEIRALGTTGVRAGRGLRAKKFLVETGAGLTGGKRR